MIVEPGLTIACSKNDVKNQVYTSQTFVDPIKLEKVRHLDRIPFDVPCAYEVDEKGCVRFVLLDGHHRALFNYHEGIGLIIIPTAKTAKRIQSFREFYKCNVAYILSE